MTSISIGRQKTEETEGVWKHRPKGGGSVMNCLLLYADYFTLTRCTIRRLERLITDIIETPYGFLTCST
jgi:hypothetical protein